MTVDNLYNYSIVCPKTVMGVVYITVGKKMIEKVANRQYEMSEFPYFVPEEELDCNIEYAKENINGDWVRKNWEEQTNHGGKHK